MIKLELHKDWYFFVLENDDVTWKPRIQIVTVWREISSFPFIAKETTVLYSTWDHFLQEHSERFTANITFQFVFKIY